MKRHAKKVALSLGILVGVATWLYCAPHRTVRRMGRAAQKGDTVSFMNHVDFSSFRSSVQTNLTAALVKPATNAEMAAFQTMFVRPSIDKALAESLTPEKLSAQMMAAFRTNTLPPGRYIDLHTFAF